MSNPPPTANIRRVCIESPLAGDVALNTQYAEACMLDSLLRGEAPFLGHLLYPRVLDDANPDHRAQGIAGHLAWLKAADVVVLYTDRGVSAGMDLATLVASDAGIPVERRQLGSLWRQQLAAARRPTDGVHLMERVADLEAQLDACKQRVLELETGR